MVAACTHGQILGLNRLQDDTGVTAFFQCAKYATGHPHLLVRDSVYDGNFSLLRKGLLHLPSLHDVNVLGCSYVLRARSTNNPRRFQHAVWTEWLVGQQHADDVPPGGSRHLRR